MTASFQLQSHKVVFYQHSIPCIKTLSVGFPALCLLLQNGSKPVNLHETVAFDAFEEEVRKN